MDGFASQGTVRYAVLLDSAQAEQGLTRFKTGLTGITAPTQQVNNQMGILNNNFKATAGGLTQQNILLGQTATQSKSLGTQIKDTTAKYSTFAIGLSATATSVLALGAGFRDYSDAQIAVDRQTRRVSLAHEALDKALDKVEKLKSKGIRSGKEYERAQLDVAQAQSFLKTQTELLGERQETLFDTQSRFVATLAPAIIGTVGTMGAAFKDLGLSSGKLKGVFAGIGTGVASLVGHFTGIGKVGKDAATGMLGMSEGMNKASISAKGLMMSLGPIALVLAGITAAVWLFTRAQEAAVKQSEKMKDIAKNVADVSQRIKEMNAVMDESIDKPFGEGWIENIANFLTKLGPGPGLAKLWGDGWKKNNAIAQQTSGTFESVKSALDALNAANANVTEALKHGIPEWIEDAKSKQKSAYETYLLSKANYAAAQAVDNLSLATGHSVVEIKKRISVENQLALAMKQHRSVAIQEAGGVGELNTAFSEGSMEFTKYIDTTNTGVAAAKRFHDLLADWLTTEFKVKGAMKMSTEELKLRFDALAGVEGAQKRLNDFLKKGTTAIQDYTTAWEGVIRAQLDIALAADEQNKTRKEEITTITNASKAYIGLQGIQGKSITHLQSFNEVIGVQIDALQDQVIQIQKVKDAEAIATATTYDFIDSQFNIIAASIKVNKIFDESVDSYIKINQARIDGLQSAQDFVTNLKLTEVATINENIALLKYANTLGISSNLLAFSGGKMKELLTLVTALTTGYQKQQTAIAMQTAFLKDNNLIMAVRRQGMLDGLRAANDWTISMIQSVAASKAEHEQLVQLTATMLNLPISIGATDEALNKAMTTFQETGDAGRALAQMMTDKLAPSFERLSEIIQSKDMKELRENLKNMELPKGFSKDIDDAFKPLQGAAESARKVGNAIDIIVTAGENMSKKDLKGNMNALRKELDEMSKIKGTSAPVDAILDSLGKMSPQEMSQHTGSMQFLVDTINKFGKLPADKAKDFIDMYNSETPKIGPASDTAAVGVDKLTASFNKLAKAGSSGNIRVGSQLGAYGPPSGDLKEKSTAKIDSAQIQNNNQLARTIAQVTSNTEALSKANNTLARTVSQVSTNSSEWTKTNNGLARTVAQVASNAGDLTKSNNTLAKTINQVASNTQSWTKANNAVARTISQVANNVKDLTKANNTAARTLSQMASNIKSVTSAANTAARAIKQLGSNISSLKDKTVTVKVNQVGGSGIRSAQHGMHETIAEDTLIQAHARERIDIGPQKAGGQSHSWSGGGGGGTGGGNIVIENHMHIMNEDIVRKLTAKQGQNRYRFG